MKIKSYVTGYATYEDRLELGKTYACKFKPCEFVRKLFDFYYHFPFKPEVKVVKLKAYGKITRKGNTDIWLAKEVKPIKVLTWSEILNNTNYGLGNQGFGNVGSFNWGSYNNGLYNTGQHNTGDNNSGMKNSGDGNSGDYNSGKGNSGDWNSGDKNSGSYNSGSWNSGDYNTGCHNSGTFNVGFYNSGNCNIGHFNSCDHSNGCFNTITEDEDKKIRMFNKQSNMTYGEWLLSPACQILLTLKDKEPQEWWNELTLDEQLKIMDMPNFDSDIFEEIMGIKIDWEES